MEQVVEEEVIGVQHIIVVQVEMEEEEEDHLLKVFNVLNVVVLIMLPHVQATYRVITMGAGAEVEGERNDHLALQAVLEGRVAFSATIVVVLIMLQLARTRDKYSNIGNTNRFYQNRATSS